MRQFSQEECVGSLGEAGRRSARSGSYKMLTLGMVVASCVGLAIVSANFLAGFLKQAPVAQTQPVSSDAPQKELFKGWQNPLLVLVLSGETHGYIKECGCSEPQYGGLERRYNLIQALKKRGWNVASFDLGDVPQIESVAGLPDPSDVKLWMRKYQLSMFAMEKMGTTAVGIGEYERKQGLTKITDDFAINFKKPRLLGTNLANRAENFPGDSVGSWAIAENTGPLRVGVASVTGRSLRARLEGESNVVAFEADTKKVVMDTLGEMTKAQVKFRILMYHYKYAAPTPQDPKTELEKLVDANPQFELILARSRDDEPPGVPSQIGNTTVVQVGHKGKYVGVVGVFQGKAAGTYDLRYELVKLAPEFRTPADQTKGQPVLELLEGYTKQLREDKVLRKYPKTLHPVQVAYPESVYVGSDACKDCHKSAYAVWKDQAKKGNGLGHAEAYETLVNAKNPSNREFDPECIVCHVVGFKYKSGFIDDKTDNFLDTKGVGCESCHGPASEHVAKPRDAKLNFLLNPWRPLPKESEAEKTKRMLSIDRFCQQCHDNENDVHWNFNKKWEAVKHVLDAPREAK